MLTGKYTRADLQPGSMDQIGSRKAINAVTGRLTERSLDIADVVVEVAREANCSPAQLALAWTLRNPAVAAPVVGVRTPEQLADNLGALEVEITDEQLARLDAISAVEKVFPMDVLKSPAEGMMFGGVKVAERG
jgi:aryl-alcohol dehydrogenase-like predicted oxidoreductase